MPGVDADISTLWYFSRLKLYTCISNMTLLQTTIVIVKNTHRFELQNAAAILDDVISLRGSNLPNSSAK